MLQLLRQLIRFIVLVFVVLILYLNVRLYDEVTCDPAPGGYVNVDVLKQLHFLRRMLREEKAGEEMQLLYPEGYIFTYALYALAWCDVVKALSPESVPWQDGMREIAIFAKAHDEVLSSYSNMSGHREVLETVRRIINWMIADLTQTTSERIAASGVQSIEDVRNAPALASFSDEMLAQMRALKAYLSANLYRDYQVLRMSRKAQSVIEELFDVFVQEPRLLPPDYVVDKNFSDALQLQARRIADYIAGMTDRYAMKEHARLFVLGAVE